MKLLQITQNATQIAKTTTSYIEKITDMAISYAPKVIGAIIIYVVGNWMIGKIIQIIKKIFAQKNYDPSLETFLISLVKVDISLS